MLVPITPSAFDLVAAEVVVIMAKEADARFMCILNNVSAREKKLALTVRFILKEAGVHVAKQEIANRVAHKHGATVGKTSSELPNGAAASEEIHAVWLEIQAEIKKLKAAKKRKAKARG